MMRMMPEPPIVMIIAMGVINPKTVQNVLTQADAFKPVRFKKLAPKTQQLYSMQSNALAWLKLDQ